MTEELICTNEDHLRMYINPQNIQGGDTIIDRGNLFLVGRVDNERGLLVYIYEPGAYIETLIQDVWLVEKGTPFGFDKGSPSLPINPEGIGKGDVVWHKWKGPLIVAEVEPYCIWTEEDYKLSFRQVSLSCKANDEGLTQKLAIMKAAWRMKQ